MSSSSAPSNKTDTLFSDRSELSSCSSVSGRYEEGVNSNLISLDEGVSGVLNEIEDNASCTTEEVCLEVVGEDAAVATEKSEPISQLSCEIGLGHIKDQVSKQLARTGTSFTILVCGDRELGKTTFINTLFEPETHSRSSDKAENDANNFSFQFYNAVLKTADFKLNLTLIDTPGFFDTTNNKHAWVPIANYIDEQMNLKFFQEDAPERTNALDTTVHACIYFITPSLKGLTESDIRAMKEIGSRVNLIPVISKADSFTKDQITKFKKEAKIVIQKECIQICQNCQGAINTDEMPFSIIGAEDYVISEKGDKIRGRAYTWGIAEVENDNHCDFNLLKNMLLSQHTLDLIEGTNTYYELYRTDLISLRADYYNSEEFHEVLPKSDKIRLQSSPHFEFNDDDPLSSLQRVSVVTLDKLKEILITRDPIFKATRDQIQKNFNSIVKVQDKKFKEWRSMLIERQKTLNKEMKLYENTIIQLQEEISFLEISSADPLVSTPVESESVQQ